MNFEEAKIFLNKHIRWELRDHAFGDLEFGWTDVSGKEIAGGYSGGGKCEVWITGDPVAFFNGDTARELKTFGITGKISRNDMTGPDEFVEGYIMPGLTKEAVLEEITKRPE